MDRWTSSEFRWLRRQRHLLSPRSAPLTPSERGHQLAITLLAKSSGTNRQTVLNTQYYHHGRFWSLLLTNKSAAIFSPIFHPNLVTCQLPLQPALAFHVIPLRQRPRLAEVATVWLTGEMMPLPLRKHGWLWYRHSNLGSLSPGIACFTFPMRVFKTSLNATVFKSCCSGADGGRRTEDQVRSQKDKEEIL